MGLIYFYHCSIILPSTPRPSMLSFSFRFLCQNPVCLSVPCYMCHMPHCLILFDLITVTVSSEDCKSVNSLLFNFLHPRVTSSSIVSKYLPQCPVLELITVTVSSEDCKSVNSSLFNFLHPRVTSSSILCPNIFLSALFLNTLCVFLPERDRPRFTPPSNRKNYISVQIIVMF